MNHRTLFVMQQIARQDILKANEFEPEVEASIKYQLGSQMISTQILSDSLQTTAEKDDGLQGSDLKYRGDGDDAQETAIGDTLESSAGVFDRLMDFLEPKPMLVTRYELGQQEISKELKEGEQSIECKDDSDFKLIDRGDGRTGRRADFREKLDGISDYDEGSCVDAVGSNRESPLSDIASLSDGSLADLSSLASDQPRHDYKTRSSRKRHKKKNNSEDAGLSSDESVIEMEERKTRQSKNKNISQTRESSASLDYPNNTHGM